LQVINSSPGDLAPVFDAILEKAHSLCGASHGALVTYDGEYFRAVATHELPALFADLLRQPFRPEPASPQAQLLRGERLVHMPDASGLHGPGWDGPRTRAAREAGLRALDSDHDVFLALRKWVEHGIAPTRIIGTKYVGDDPAHGVAFTRPMCPYPQQARYRGAGATIDAANFARVSDESDSNGPIIDDFGRFATILGYAALMFQ
jgi:hypothetical protein